MQFAISDARISVNMGCICQTFGVKTFENGVYLSTPFASTLLNMDCIDLSPFELCCSGVELAGPAFLSFPVTGSYRKFGMSHNFPRHHKRYFHGSKIFKWLQNLYRWLKKDIKGI